MFLEVLSKDRAVEKVEPVEVVVVAAERARCVWVAEACWCAPLVEE